MKQNAKTLIPVFFLWLSSSIFYAHQYMLRVLPSTLRHELIQHYNIQLVDVAQISSFFFFSYLLSLLFSGYIIQKLGKPMTLLLAVILNQLGIFLFYASNSLEGVILSEIMFGVSGSFSLNIALSTIKELKLEKNKVLLNAITLSFGALGILIGGWPLESLVDLFDWKITILLFFTASNLLILFLCFQYFLLKKTPSLFFAKAKNIEATNQPTDKKFKYLSWELWGPTLYGCFQFLPSICFATVWLVPFAHLELGAHKMYAAFSPATVYLGITFGLITNGRILPKIKNKNKYLICSSIIACTASMIIIYFTNIPLIGFFALLFILGACMSTYLVTTSMVQTQTAPHFVSVALAINLFFLNVGGFVALVLIDLLLKLEYNFFAFGILKSYHFTFVLIPTSFIIAAIIAGFLPKNNNALSKMK
tara:strand:- start:107 stop:1369 length:1263 start_codon:yes stop_codon:yes gene_type:complete